MEESVIRMKSTDILFDKQRIVGEHFPLLMDML